MENNPFSLDPHAGGTARVTRRKETEAVLAAFCFGDRPSHICFVTGAAGSGKTDLLREAAACLAEQDPHWQILKIEPGPAMLEELPAALFEEDTRRTFFSEDGLDLSFFGLGPAMPDAVPITSIGIAISKMLESIACRKGKVLLLVDASSGASALKKFLQAFRLFLRQGLPLYLLLAGPPELIRLLQKEADLPQTAAPPVLCLRPLGLRGTANLYREIFSLSEDDASEMAAHTKGYPFAVQALGFLTWENGGDFRGVLEKYRQYLWDFSYDRIWSRLSAEDKRVLYGVASASGDRITDIRKILGLDTNHFNPYRDRLIRKGLLDGEQYGRLRINLPAFREYVLEMVKAEALY